MEINKPDHNQSRYDLLVTGGTGFVGQEFVSQLIRRFDGNIFIGQRAKREFLGRESNLSYGHLDLEKFSSPCGGARIVVHIAGEKTEKNKMMQINVEGTRQLLNWSVSAGVEKFVYLSSDGVYGADNQAGLVNSSHVKAPKNEYERSKMLGENLVREITDRHGIKWIILQPTNIIGVNSRSRNPLIGLFRSVKSDHFRYIGHEPGYVNYVAVENVVESIFHVISTADATGTYIINTPAKLTEFIEEIAKLLHVEVPRRRIPRLPAACAAAVFSAIETCIGKKMPFNLIKYRELTNQTIYEGGEIEKSLNFNYPVSWQQMVSKLADTYHKMGLL